jgi:O-antigen/teichoic acid export membrane protein
VALLPAYLRFFGDDRVLGVWYTVLSLLNWVAMFDLGLGHSLRNKLPYALEQGDRAAVRAYISTTYGAMGVIVGVLILVGMAVIHRIPWNSLLRLEETVVDGKTLARCMETVFLGIMAGLFLRIVTGILYAMQRAALVNALTLIGSTMVLVGIWLLPRGGKGENLQAVSVLNAASVTLPYLVCTLVLFLGKLRDCAPALRFFQKSLVRQLVGTGLTILWLNVVFMVVTSANEFLITRFSGSQFVVEYQVYQKLFNTAAMVVSLALVPVWSAVTGAAARGDMQWIQKVYRLFLVGCGLCFVIQLCVIPVLQPVVNLWLGENAIRVQPGYALVFALSGSIFVLHNVNTSISNGLSWFRLQLVWMSVAAAVFVPLAWVLTRQVESWIGVILAGCLAVLPYEILAPIHTLRRLKREP